jgi:hypothetical protein
VFGLLTQSTLPHETNVANASPASGRCRRSSPPPEKAWQPAARLVETAIQQNRGALRFFESDVFALAGDRTQRAALQAAVDELLPVLRDYQAFLEDDLLPRANGEWRIGRDKFYRKFELETDAGLTAEQIYADALAEFERVRNDMYVIARQAWSGYFPGVALPPDDPRAGALTVERVLERIARNTANPSISPATPAPPWPTSNVSSPMPNPHPARSRPLPHHRDAGVPARQFHSLHGLAPAARPGGHRSLCHQPAARVVGRGPGQELSRGIQPPHAADPDHPRGLSRAITCRWNTPTATRRSSARCSAPGSISKVGPSIPSR